MSGNRKPGEFIENHFPTMRGVKLRTNGWKIKELTPPETSKSQHGTFLKSIISRLVAEAEFEELRLRASGLI